MTAAGRPSARWCCSVESDGGFPRCAPLYMEAASLALANYVKLQEN